MRFLTAEQYATATERMAAIVTGHLAQTSATIEFDLEYPSMAPTDGNQGVLGDDAHAPGEYLEIDAMAVQVRRAALLFHRLTR